MIRVINYYSDIPEEDPLLKMMGDQMSGIGSPEAIKHLKRALKNGLRAESRVYLFISLSPQDELQGFAFTNLCSGLESGADYIWINELFIAEAFRQQGQAEELLSYIEEWAADKNIHYMACITSSTNIPAQKLYSKKGFEITETLWVDKALERKNDSEDDLKIMEIRILRSNEAAPMDLLLNADPSETLVKEYLAKGMCIVAEIKSKIMGALILMPLGQGKMEIMNISVHDSVQNRGIGKALIHRAIKEAQKSGTEILEIGTGNPGFGQLYLYQKCGFRISGVDRDFFRRNYKERIYENGLECRDMVRLSLELK